MKSQILVPALVLVGTVSLVGCNSSDNTVPETASPNISETRLLVEQAQRDWQTTGLQNYAYTNPVQLHSCDGGITFVPIPTTHIVQDTGEVYAVYQVRNAGGGESSYVTEGATYEQIHQALLGVLDDGPVLLGSSAQNLDELPIFDDQGLVKQWYHRESSVERNGCHYTASTRTLTSLDALDYPLHDYVQAMESGFETWQQANIQDYTYRARIISGACEAPQTSSLATIRVVDGQVEAVEWDGDDAFTLYAPTIEIAFDQLAANLAVLPRALTAGVDSNETIEFDPNFGFPLSFYAEHGSASADACNSTGFIIESFE